MDIPTKFLLSRIQPGSKEAFLAFVDALQQLYVMGAAVELNALGYRMIKG